MRHLRFALALVLAAGLLFPAEGKERKDMPDSLQALPNPERGFYRTAFLRLKTADNRPAPLPAGPLVHLRIDLSAFSAAGGGMDAPLNTEALQALRDTLEAVRRAGKGVIIRSCYDAGFAGRKDTEPEMALLCRHLQQLGAVYTAYADVIVCLELGMFGPWGEMHSSRCCTQENVNRALDTLLDATPASLSINLRTPQYVAGWLGISPAAGLDGRSSAYTAAMKAKGPRSLRVGLFNDGYLGSGSDLGTFTAVPREAGVAWLAQAAARTFYGGEAVTDASGSTQGAFNTLQAVASEAPRTHTTYLNAEWNTKLHAAWKSETFRREGDEYDGRDGLTYISDHLGYRLVLRRADIKLNAADKQKLTLRLRLENVGFAPVIKPKDATILLVHEDGVTQRALPWQRLDIRTLSAGTTDDYTFTARLTPRLKCGKWTVRLRLACPGYTSAAIPPAIRFANTEADWDASDGSNRLGTFVVR